ncbi:putative hydroxymethylpyrimidine transport system substrate-binding protein [Paenibacillus sophorae]|uniref:ABC transporter substrate-binding protein n=1 Tax=Paenibacillus sophorae TaxID=1333845 RepID=A0A1H8JZQ5_9BACL|nr:ABC transporter substrate-binding protein [Paenibacillus sophorae]QWU13547.1 ABC transporter substrate-binding protein [Paenibacillus sophorae]SEN86249.1 putative hydroxymethylpyrimidine transport system substrate-binding protein [Paenibacillus sophorae]
MKSFTRIKNLLLLPAISLLLLTAACGGSAPSGDSAASASPSPAASQTESPAEPAHKLTLMLDWYPNAVHSFLYTAQEKGFFAKRGINVEIQMPADTNDALKLVAAGKVDLALSYQPQVLMARGEKIPVKALASIVRHPLTHLMVPADSSVHTPKDLAGKAVGYSSIPLYEAMVKTMVKADGGDPEKVNFVDVGYDLIPAISTGQTDAIMGGFINHEQLILQKEGHPVTSIDPAKYGVPDYSELVLVASDEGINQHKDDFIKFLTAMREGQAYVNEHPDEALSILLAHEDGTAPLDKEIETQSLKVLLPLMDAGDKDFGFQDAESWDKVHQWLEGNGLLPADIKAEDAFINL